MKKNVLIVDDDENFRNSIKSLLETKDIDYEEAKGVREARLKLNKYKFDLIILDMLMHTGDISDGISVLESIRKLKNQIPTIVISVSANELEYLQGVNKFDFIEYTIPKKHFSELKNALSEKIDKIFSPSNTSISTLSFLLAIIWTVLILVIPLFLNKIFDINEKAETIIWIICVILLLIVYYHYFGVKLVSLALNRYNKIGN